MERSVWTGLTQQARASWRPWCGGVRWSAHRCRRGAELADPARTTLPA